MFRKIKAYLPFYLLTAILLPTLIVLADIANDLFTPLEPQFDFPLTPENSPKSMREFWNPAMAGSEGCPLFYESPFIPFKYYAERGTTSFFIRGEKYFPIDPSKCSDLVLDRMGMAECLKRHGIKPEDLPPINPPPNRVPPLPPDAERLFFSIRGEGRFKAPPRISPEGKVGHPAGEPLWWRAIGLRLSPDFIQALETSLSNYLSNNINTDVNKICNPITGGSSYRYQRNSDNTCTDLQWCAGSGSASGACGSLVSCPGSTCTPSSSACIDVPMLGDCATKDNFPCDTNGACAVVANDNNCIYIGTPLVLQLADCSNVNSISCPYTSSCADDGLAVDVYVPRFAMELFMRVVNYIPTPAHCNSPTVEHRCWSCGSSNDCCPDAEFCGLLDFCWLPTDGCPCCDDDVRTKFRMDDIWAYNIAFLFYGPNAAPFMTPCGSPATQWHGGHPGEWIDLCACNQDVSFGSYNVSFCDWGFLNLCGIIASFVINRQRDNVRCTVSRQLNSLLSGALKSFLADVFPLSAMELLGACSTNAYHIGFYPEICAGRSLGYPWDYWNGGAGLVLFVDMTWQLGTPSSCVAGSPCPTYPTSVPSTPCKSSPQTCLPASGYDIGIYVDQGLINELFYVFWSQGLLCYTFRLSPDQAWMLIPGLRQVVGSPTAVDVSFIPVCNPTPQFSTSGGTFTLTIPRFYLRFRTAGGTQLFDIQMRMTISGQLGYAVPPNCASQPVPDPLCGSTFRCKRCYSWGCQDEYVQYGPGYLQITNITIDPVVEDIVNRHPQINATPPYTEIADVIAVLLDGLINNALIRTRIYNLLGILPLKMDLPGFYIGFQNNALVARLTLPRPLCINFLLEFGQFSPQIGLASSEFSEIPPDFQIAPKPKVETIVIPEENGRIFPESINYQEEKREYVINSDEPIRFKVKSKIDNFYPDENSSVELLWRYEGGYMWHKIENGEFYFKPVSETTVEIFTAVRHLPSGVYTIVDENPVKIKVKKGIQGKIEGPDKLRPGELGVFEVKADYENLEISYGVDDGDFTRFLPTRTIKLRFEEGGKHTLKVILKSGEKYGVVSKEIEVEGEPAKGCGGPGLPFGLSLTGIFAIFFLTIGKRKKVKNGKK
jgi:hypothetical protein